MEQSETNNAVPKFLVAVINSGYSSSISAKSWKSFTLALYISARRMDEGNSKT